MSDKTTGAALSSEVIDSLQGIYDKYKSMPGATIPILQDIQNACGYIQEEAVNWVADKLDLPRSSFYGVATFYSQFYMKPKGKHVITVCCGTACHVKGSERILDNLVRELGLPEGEDTTSDQKFTVEKVNCVGACSIAPVVIIDKKINGKATSNKTLRKVKNIMKEDA